MPLVEPTARDKRGLSGGSRNSRVFIPRIRVQKRKSGKAIKIAKEFGKEIMYGSNRTRRRR